MSQASNRTVQRHFPPLVLHSSFGPECLLSPTRLTLNTVFAADVGKPPVLPPSVRSGNEAANPSGSFDPIPKPKGDVCRPSRHGYTLSVVLNWPPHIYEEVETYMQSIALKHLDIRKHLREQKDQKLSLVHTEAETCFPILSTYKDGWATKDFLRIALSTAKAQAQAAANSDEERD
ncbi:hypothetical protein BJ138DRAFT_1119183 [Hygrophoropsis aurantiaca]|uniref:Uncharacterized protein n=1 Tax=Hygrophoropsis aurantiaca TaxID=72124 RepID=A0ACB7ZUZ5_9AGAM|nr:hypothetical protein BJ138DRAFT_1119183 [Hygrophoropsis aurantiaca]